MKIHGLSHFFGSVFIWQPGKTFLPVRDYTRWSEYVHAESYVIFPEFRGGFRSESIQLGVLQSSAQDIEQFLFMIRFDSRQKLEDLVDFQLNQLYFFNYSVRVSPGLLN